MRAVVTPAQSQQFKCASWCMLAFLPHVDRAPKGNALQYPVPTGFVVAIPAEYQSLPFEPHCFALRTMVGINTYLSLEKGQCKICSCSLLPFPLGLPPQPLKKQVTNCRSAGRGGTGIAQGLHTRVTTSPCLLLHRAGSSPSWWMAICHLQLTYRHGCMRTKFPNPLSPAHRS